MATANSGRAGPLSVVTIATQDFPATRRFYGDGMGLRCVGPLPADGKARAARAAVWRIAPDLAFDEYSFHREGVPDAARLRVLALQAPSPAWRGGWEPGILGPYTLGFPNTQQDRLHERLLSLGFGARNPVERTEYRHPDGRCWEISESLLLAPDGVAAVGIQRGSDQPPISPVNASGLGGPAYSMCIVSDIERMTEFMRGALGYEIRNRRRQVSAGRRGAMNTPDGTEFEIAQCSPATAQHGFLILLQFRNLAVVAPPRPPRLPASGIVMYSFETDDLDALLERAARCGATDIVGPRHLDATPPSGTRSATCVTPEGLLFEFTSAHGSVRRR